MNQGLRRIAGVAVAAAMAFVAGGCAGGSAPPVAAVAADCAARVRMDGVVYSSYGFTDHRATALSWAEEAVCEDVGASPAGSVFPAAPHRVRTWRFEEYPPSQVVGVRSGDRGSFAVFVADSVDPAERERIYAELSGPSQG